MKIDDLFTLHDADETTLPSTARRRFLGHAIKVTGIFVAGPLLSLTFTREASGDAQGIGVVGTFSYKPHYSMVVHQDRCTGCGKCVTACRQVNNVPDDGYRNTIYKRKTDGNIPARSIEFMPVLCNHCNRPPCVRVCPSKAIYKDKQNGIVKVNAEMCIGCKACMASCPYNALYYKQASKAVDKCDFCFKARLDQGRPTPACVESCPPKALFFGDLADPQSEVYRLLHSPDKTVWALRPELGTMPNVFYLKA